jgi:exopolysaccharide biosynthesis protein
MGTRKLRADYHRFFRHRRERRWRSRVCQGLLGGCNFQNKSLRVAIGINKNGKMSIIAPTGPLTGAEMARLTKNLGYKNVIMFDGGSKSYLNFNGKILG